MNPAAGKENNTLASRETNPTLANMAREITR